MVIAGCGCRIAGISLCGRMWRVTVSVVRVCQNCPWIGSIHGLDWIALDWIIGSETHCQKLLLSFQICIGQAIISKSACTDSSHVLLRVCEIPVGARREARNTECFIINCCLIMWLIKYFSFLSRNCCFVTGRVEMDWIGS